ncbi:MAG: alpha/beta hydrolase [Gammaproteobacteria bacterium]|nr:alpha/beta hydrolase [Gammaproteobacteria bacterium]
MERVEVAGLTLDVERVGDGPPMLYLHPEHYWGLNAPFVEQLSTRWSVLVPHHPGFDNRQPPSDFRSVGDLAYLYLDLLDALEVHNPLVVGASLGGWIGLEMAVRQPKRLRGLGLIAPLGAKLGGREARDFADLFAMSDDEAASSLFAQAPPDLQTFTDDEMTQVARDRQFAAYYGWKPYMHNPSLPRWLHRAAMPVQLIWGQKDGFVSCEYARLLNERLPHSSLSVIDNAGHYPQLESSTEVSAIIEKFGAAVLSDGETP